MFKKVFSVLFIFSIIASLPTAAWAVGSGGFENASFSAAQLATAGAGTASPNEPAAISYNPAGINDLEGIQVQTGTSFISLFTHYKSEDISNTRSSGTISPVPTAYITVNPGKKFLNDKLAFGIGIDSPFGLSNKYDSNHPITHYTGWKNWIKMYSLKLVASVKATEWLSLSAGPVYYRIYDFGAIQAYPNVVSFATFGSGLLTDGQVRVNMSGNTWGWQFGALLKPHKKHRLGFYFRSPLHMKLKGLAKVENSTSGYFETGVHTKLNLPLNFTFAYAFQPTERTHYDIDFGFTRWSIHERLSINADPVNAREDIVLRAIGQPNIKKYRNSFSLHLGATHKLTDRLTLKGGTHYYWTPVPKSYFTPAVPDSNRIALGLGLGYDITDNFKVDLSYLQVFFLRRRVDNTISEGLGTTVDGRYSGYLQEFTLSFTYKWDTFGTRKNDNVEETGEELAEE